jgi:hypothetical protein
MKRFNYTNTLFTFGVSALVLTGCFGTESDSKSKQKSGVVPETSELIYDLPSAMASQNPAQASGVLAKTNAETDESIFDVYKPVPVYIWLAEQAKNQVKIFADELAKLDIPEKFYMVAEDGNIITSTTIDTTVLGAPQKFFKIKIEDPNEAELELGYWKNARDQYRGYFLYKAFAGKDSGMVALVRFNGHNQEVLGKRMVVTLYQNPQNLENPGDPSVIRVAAVKKGDKVLVSGISYHPEFSDELFGEGERVYAFVAAANEARNVAVLKASLAPADVSLDELFTTYTLDNQVLIKGFEIFKTEAVKDADLEKLVLWSFENNTNISAFINDADYETYVPSIQIADLSLDQFKTWLVNNKQDILNGDDEGFKQFLIFVSITQPIYFQADALMVGDQLNNPGEDFGISALDLDDEDLTIMAPEAAVSFDPEQIDLDEE